MLSWPDFRYKQIAIYRSTNKGERLRFRADNIVIENDEGEVLFQHSCHRLFALFLIGEMSLTSVVIKHSVAFAFPIILMNANFKVIARINCQAEGNTLLRRKQYEMSETKQCEIAKLLISQKVNNQRCLLEQLRYHAVEDKEAIDYLRRLSIDAAIDKKELLGIEGSASKAFFGAYFRPLGWRRREPRCKQDIYNLLLDIGYTYLFQFVEAMEEAEDHA
jgi:CRISPR-associated protein Cas1